MTSSRSLDSLTTCAAGFRDQAQRAMQLAESSKRNDYAEQPRFLTSLNELLAYVVGWTQRNFARTRFPEAVRGLQHGLREVLAKTNPLPQLEAEEMTELALCLDELAYALECYVEAHRNPPQSPSLLNDARASSSAPPSA